MTFPNHICQKKASSKSNNCLFPMSLKNPHKEAISGCSLSVPQDGNQCHPHRFVPFLIKFHIVKRNEADWAVGGDHLPRGRADPGATAGRFASVRPEWRMLPPFKTQLLHPTKPKLFQIPSLLFFNFTFLIVSIFTYCKVYTLPYL